MSFHSPTSAAFHLSSNYPNPFNPTTIIQYQLPEGSYVSLRVYNTLRQEVKTLVNEEEDAGYKIALFDASNLPSGVYFYRFTASSFTVVRKMLLMK